MKAQLSKIKMPSKSAVDNEADMDLESLQDDMPGAGGGEMSDDIGAELGMEQGGMDDEQQIAELEHLSDDNLLAELKRRGLMSESSPVGKAAESDIVDEDALSRDESAESPEEEEMESPAEQQREKQMGIEKRPMAKKKAKY